MKSRVMLLLSAFAILSTPTMAADRQSRRAFRAFSECEVGANPKGAAAVVLSDSTSETLKDSEFTKPHYCLSAGGGWLRIPPGEFILFGLADALLHRDYWRGLPPDISRAAPLTHAQVDESEYKPKPGKKASPAELADLQEAEKHAQAMRALSIYGECVARTDPTTALSLALSEPETGYEAAAFSKLQPALSSCLDKGKSVVLDKAAVRGAIALNLYRLAKAPRVKSTTVTK